MMKKGNLVNAEYLGKTSSGEGEDAVEYHEWLDTVTGTLNLAVVSEDTIKGIERFIRELERKGFRLKEKNTLVDNDEAGKQGVVVYNALVEAFGKRIIKRAMKNVLGQNDAKMRFKTKHKKFKRTKNAKLQTC